MNLSPPLQKAAPKGGGFFLSFLWAPIAVKALPARAPPLAVRLPPPLQVTSRQGAAVLPPVKKKASPLPPLIPRADGVY